MKRMNSRLLFGAAIAALLAVDPTAGVAQTTFQACRIPNVGAIYMINVAGAPAACLDASHVAFSWTEGGAPADGSVTTAKLADGAVTSLKVADGTIGVADIATDGVGAAEIVADAVGTSEIAANGVGTAEIADGAVTQAKLDAGVSLGFTTVTARIGTGTSLPAGSSTFISSVCLAGEVVTGGGAVNVNANGVYVKQSYPSGGNAWNVTYQNTSGFAETGYAYAMCAS